MLKNFLSREPVLIISFIAAIAYTALRVLGPEKLPLDEVFTEDYAVYLVGLATAIAARLSVFSPKSAANRADAAVVEAQVDVRPEVNEDDEAAVLEELYGPADKDGIYRGEGL